MPDNRHGVALFSEHDGIAGLGFFDVENCQASELLAKIENPEKYQEVKLSFELSKDDLQELQKFVNLKKLDISRCTLSEDAFSELKAFSGLTDLNLGYATLKGTDYSALGNLTHLSRLVLHNTTIDDSAMKAIGELDKLEVLDLIGTNVSDKGASELKNLKELTTLLHFLKKDDIFTKQ